MKLAKTIAGAEKRLPLRVVLKDYYSWEGVKNNQLLLVEEEVNKFLLKNPKYHSYVEKIAGSDYLFHEFYSDLCSERFFAIIKMKLAQKYIHNAIKGIVKNWEHYLSEEQRIDYEAKNKIRPNVGDYNSVENQEKMHDLLIKAGLL